jgi:N utilization substance protein B
MTKRRRAREVVLQLLYQCDHNPSVDPEQVRNFLQTRLRQGDLIDFAHGLLSGVSTHRKEIDQQLSATAENWSVERMATVDRNVLRLGTYELLYQTDTPPKVAMDEAVELAKRYGAAESPAFVNGVLDRVAALKMANDKV